MFVLVGILRKPHGLRGEALVSIETDFPDRLIKGKKLYLGGRSYLPLTLKSRRETNEGLLLAFEELPGRESLEQFHNESLFIKVSDIPPLERGHYYQHQLIGLDVVTEQGELLGKLTQVMDTTANDVYIVKNESNTELLLPAIADVIRKVDLDNKRIIVALLPGLLP